MSNEETRRTAGVCLAKARQKLQQGNFSKARALVKKAQRIFPQVEGCEGLLAAIARVEASGSARASPRSEARPSSARRSSAAASSSSSSPRAPPRQRRAASASTPSTQSEADRVKVALVAAVLARGQGKDFYKILAVARNADDKTIKRAYRKLAVKLHPDKNQAPGADEAFKMISEAFTTLQDPEKRRDFDRFGPEVAGQRGGGGGGGGRRRRGGGFQQHDMQTPEDIFNMFFGGGMAQGRRGGNRRQRRAAQQQGQGQGQQQEQSPLMQFAHLAPLLLLFIISFANLSGGTAPSISVTKTPEMPYRMTSQGHGLPYYISSDERRKVREKAGHRATLDGEADNTHYQQMSFKCRQKREQNQMQAQRLLWSRKTGSRNQAHALQRKEPQVCSELREIFGRG